MSGNGVSPNTAPSNQVISPGMNYMFTLLLIPYGCKTYHPTEIFAAWCHPWGPSLVHWQEGSLKRRPSWLKILAVMFQFWSKSETFQPWRRISFETPFFSLEPFSSLLPYGRTDFIPIIMMPRGTIVELLSVQKPLSVCKKVCKIFIPNRNLNCTQKGNRKVGQKKLLKKK